MKTKEIILMLITFGCSSSPEKTEQKKANSKEQESDKILSQAIIKDKGYLEKESKQLRVQYGGISCSCAQWFNVNTKLNADSSREYFYLEQADPTLVNADTLFNGMNLPIEIEVFGHFYHDVGSPNGYHSSRSTFEPAKVFRYEKLSVIQK